MKEKISIRPAGHRCLVAPDIIEEKTAGGLYLSVQTTERKQSEQISGTLVAVGINCWKAFDQGDAWAEVGDKVFYAKYGGFNIIDPLSGKAYRLLNDEDITAVIVTN